MSNQNSQSFSIHGSVGYITTGDASVSGDGRVIQSYTQEDLSEYLQEIKDMRDESRRKSVAVDEREFAEELVKKAKGDMNFHQKLKALGKNLATLGATELTKTTAVEMAKRVVPRALAILSAGI